MSDSLSTPPPGRGGFLRALSGRSVVVALALAIVMAAVVNPIFMTPFRVLLGRTLFIAMVLLLAFTAAGHWRQPWLPRWIMQVTAVVIATPLATYVVYLFSVDGDVSAVFHDEPRLIGFLVTVCLGSTVALVLTLGALVREREAQTRTQALQFALERETLERQALDARLSLLRSQIEPHFLFNTLANVQELVESGSPHAADVLKSLIAYLRAAIPRLHDGDETLGREESLVRAYLELMLMRMPDRLAFDVAIDPALHALRFPSMALLTLVENAVRHGIDPAEQGGRIEVGARREPDGRVRVWVADTGVGMREAGEPGTGLTNLRDRLSAFFGGSARVELAENAPHGVRAEVQFTPV